MSDKIGVGLEGSGEDGINKLITAIDRLDASLGKLAAGNTALEQLQRSMASMQASMTTGFAAMAAEAAGGAEKIRKSAEASAEKLLQAQIKHEEKQHAQANKFHYKMVEQQDTWLVKQRENYAKFWQGILAEQERAESKRAATQQRRDMEMHNQATKSHNDYISLWEKMLSERQVIQERRDMEMHGARQRDYVDYVHFWEKQLSAQDAAQKQQLEKARAQQVALHQIRATEAERSRSLNTNFLTSSLPSQIATAEKAKVYSSLGGNASEKFGSAAAGADIGALRKQHEELKKHVDASRGAISGHNDIMREGHSLARGLAGSLGGLWLTYGSLVPLAAGAAIAASLKGIVTAGKDVEYQLKFVEALGGGKVNLDQMLHITDATVVSVKEAAEGMRALAQNGLNASESLKVLPSILNLAVIGEMSVSNAALAATGTVSAFGLQLSDLDRVSNIFAQAAATSNTSVLAMTESMKQASTVSAIYGSTVEETAAALGVLAKVNIIGSAAGTAYTNMLTNMYTPTEKAKKALGELRVEAANSDGSLKNTTQLLGELRGKLSGYNEVAQASFLGDIFTVRGQKGASTILQNWDLYIKKAEEARNVTNFMGEGVSKLEDSVEGAMKRMGNSVSSSFNKAFKDSSPPLQQVIMHMGELARSDGVVTTLTGMADALLRVTRVAMEHSTTIGYMLAAYLSLRALSALPVLLGAISTGLNAATFSMRTLTAAMGWIGLAVTGVTVAYQLFIEKTSDVEKADIRRQNSIATNIEFLDREIERLKERNKLWNPETLKFDKAPVVETGTTVEEEQRALAANERRLAQIRQNQRDGTYAGTGAGGSHLAAANEASQLVDQIAASKRRLWELTAKQEDLGVQSSIDQNRRAQESTVMALENFRKQGEAYDKLSANYAGKDNDLFLAKTRQAEAIRQQLVGNKITNQEAIEQLSKLKSEASGMLAGRAPKEDKKSLNDGFRAQLQEVQNRIQASTDLAKSTQEELDSQYRTGKIAALDYFNSSRDAAVADLQTKLNLFAEDERISAARENRTADEAKFRGKQQQTARAIGEAERDRVRGINEYIFAQEQDQTRRLIEEERRRGNLRAAYQLENKDKLPALDANVQGGQAALGQAMQAGDQGQIEEASRFLNAARQAKAAYDETLKGIGNTEDFQKAEKAFDLLFTKLQTGTEQLLEKNSEGSGLGAIFTSALAAQNLYQEALPGMIAEQQKLAEIANRPGATNDQKTTALDALRAIETGAARVRDIWSDVGRDIEKALTRAFGNGGQALGRLINVTMDYGNRRKKIEDDLAKGSKGASPKDLAKMQEKASKDMASAQLSAYGDMAGAAKGFFKENSDGYRAMEAAERTFRAVELAMTMKDMVTKLFATSTVATAKVAAQGAEAAGAAATVPIVVAAEGAKQGAYGITALAAALAAPFPANIPAFAMVAAMLAAIGVAVSGGSGGKSRSAERQKLQGTGSVLGSSGTKSESIGRALEMVENNTYQNLAVSLSMLNSLRAIESNIGNFTSLVVRTTGIGNGDEASKRFESKGAAYNFGNSNIGLAILGGPIAAVFNVLLNKITNGWFGRVTGSILGKVFGGKRTVEDTGFSIDKTSLGQVLQAGVKPFQYADVKKDGGWFRSDEYSTVKEGLGADADRQFTLVIKSLYESVKQAGTMLGLEGDAFSQQLGQFVVDIGSISLKGLEGDDLQKEIEAVFSKLGDDMARFGVGGLERFQQVGEGYLETLTRVALGYQTVSIVMDSLGMSFSAVGLGSLDARQRLIDLAGGLDEFTSASQQFLQDFFSEEEQAAALRRRIQPTLDQYGLSTTGADPMKAFKDFVVALDTTTEAGAQAYTALLQISPAFKSIIESGKKLTDEARDLQDEIDDLTMTRVQLLKKERDALDPANRALFDQLQQAKAVSEARDLLSESYDNESSKLQTTVDRLKSFGESIRKFRDGLALGSASPLTPEQKYAAARAQFDSTLQLAKGGDENAQNGLEAAAQAYLEASRTYNASGAAYTSDYQRVVSAMEDAERWAGAQVTAAQQQLDALKASVSTLIEIKLGLMDVVTAINNLALLKDPNNPALQNKALTDLYGTVLGRAPDAAGMDFWLKQLQGGMSLNQISDAMKGSFEANKSAPKSIDDIYQQLLGRAPDQAGRDYWTGTGSNLETIYAQVKASSEYANKGNATGAITGSRMSVASVETSPYNFATDNSDVVNALADVTTAVQQVVAEVATLREEQQAQTGATIEAQFAAAAANAETVASATTSAVKSAEWDNGNQTELK